MRRPAAPLGGEMVRATARLALSASVTLPAPVAQLVAMTLGEIP